MSIRKKMLVFVLIIEITSMSCILLLSDIVLNRQIDKAAQSYMQNAFIIAYNQILNRSGEMEKVSVKTSKSTEFGQALQTNNIPALKRTIDEVNEIYNYLDFYMVFNEKKILITSNPNIKNPKLSRLNILMNKAESKHNTITSEEVFNLDDLFNVNSEEYNKFRVLISENDKNSSSNKYLTKCLASVSISPVYNKANGQLSGYLAIGSIINNDDYFPKNYSASVENSYLALSIDGIRIASSIKGPKKVNYIGTEIPIPISTLDGSKNGYYGKKSFDGQIHIFLDKYITNCDGKEVAAIGVGIPEEKFSIIMNAQRSIIIFATVFFLIILIFISKYFANRITEPIIVATGLANQISKGNNQIVIDNKFLKEKNSEIAILLIAFEKMASDLNKSKEEIMSYLEKLKGEHLEQEKLSMQLVELNENLEKKVQLRTQGLREALNSLKKAGQVKSLFLANMSHELRTPLSAIINCSQILIEEMFGPLNDKQKKYIKNILENSTHLLQLINDILDISKIETGKMTLILGYYSVSDIVMESFSIVKSLAYHKNIDVKININPADFKVKVDANKLKQILCNLLSNAIKFTPLNGKVVVEVSKDGEYMRLTVKDNGIGIKKEDQKRIFNEFEQVDSSYEREYEGTGLGLPLTKKLTEMHGGKIFLTSQLGIGTEVIVILPINIDEGTNNNVTIS